MLKLKFFVEGIELQAATVPNEYPFVALITYGGKPSERLVAGTEGIDGGPYQVMIPAALLREKIKELEGKAVFASEDLDSHDNAVKIGKFVSAWVEAVEQGGQVVYAAKASGLLYRNSDSDLVDKIIERARAHKLGFSYDLKEVSFELKASDSVSPTQYIELKTFKWRGATILAREAAAYEETLLAAQKSISLPKGKEPDTAMNKEEIAALLKDSLASFKTELQGSLPSKQEFQELKDKQVALEAKLTAGTTKKDEPKTSMSISDFASTIGEKLAEALKPVKEEIEKLGAQTKTDSKDGIRKSLSAAEIGWITKYQDLKDEEELTSSMLRNVIDKVSADPGMTRSAKEQVVNVLSGRRIELVRLERLRGGIA